MKGVLAWTAVLLAVGAQPAAAAFPGTDGPIAMERSGPNGARIALVNSDGTRDRDAVIAVGPDDRDASWAPDGRRVAFTSTRDGNEEVYVFDTDSGVQRRLTFGGERDHDPAWSPDGSRVAFAGERDGNSEIYVVAAAGGAPMRLTVDAADDRQPAWSSTGAIAFASSRAGGLDLYAMDDQGGNVRRLTQEPGPDVDPSWAPAGDRLVYAHADDDFDHGAAEFDGHSHQFDLFTVGSDGRDRRPVATTQAVEHFPTWSPDGERIAFAIGHGSEAAVYVTLAAAGPAVLRVARGTDPNWGPLPAPVGGPGLGSTITVAPLSGRVLIAPATAKRPSGAATLQTPLRTANEVPVHSTLDASRGRVAIEAVTTTPDGPGTVGRAEVRGGVFTVDQTGRTEPTLKMAAGIRRCQRARTSRVPPEASMRIHIRGSFRTIGGYGRGAGRGTEWSMRERCGGTVFQVFEGVVFVHDYRRRVTLKVRAGRCYLAAARRRPDALKPRRRCPAVRRSR